MTSDETDKKAQNASDDLVKKTKTRQQEVSVRDQMENGSNSALIATNQTADGGLDHTERKKKEDKKLNAMLKLNRDIVSAIAAAEAAMMAFEESLGGLDKMAEKLGIERKDNETEEEFRKRIREEITERQIAGTLDDPDGYFAGWAGEYDKIEAHKAKLANEDHQINQSYAELEGDRVGQKRVVSNGTDNNSISDATLQGGEQLTQDKGIEYRERRDQSEFQTTDQSLSVTEQTGSFSSAFGSGGSFKSAEALGIKKAFNAGANGEIHAPEFAQTADITEPVISNKMVV